MHICARSGNLTKLKLLLNHKLVTYLSIGNGDKNLLHYAACSSSPETMTYLLTKTSLDPRTPDIDGNLPIHIAASYNAQVLGVLLRDPRVDPNARNNMGQTAIHFAGMRGNFHLEVMKVLLLQPEINLSIADNDGYLPIHSACIWAADQVVGILVSDGRMLINDIKSAYDLATRLNRKDIIVRLMQEQSLKDYLQAKG
jgi:ankyrin repeat protein